MYPFLHLLRDGKLFVFTSKSSQIFDVDTGKVVREMPDLAGLHRTYPNTGGSVMLPLTKDNNYEAEIMICGGGEIDEPDSLTDDTCGRIRPLSPRPKWEMTRMPGGGRVMVEGTLLLDGTVLWLNGARRGCQGFGTASEPALDALIYEPVLRKWSTAGHTDIARLYHSVALMLLDGTILIAGSNPNEMPILEDKVDPTNPLKAFPTEFRVEKYIPFYLLGDSERRRPRDVIISEKVFTPGGTESAVNFKSKDKPRTVKVLLYHGGFVTHALHMGQVMVEMESQGLKHCGSDRYEVQVKVPGIKLAPGPYVIYVMVDDIPGVGEVVMVHTS